MTLNTQGSGRRHGLHSFFSHPCSPFCGKLILSVVSGNGKRTEARDCINATNMMAFAGKAHSLWGANKERAFAFGLFSDSFAVEAGLQSRITSPSSHTEYAFGVLLKV